MYSRGELTNFSKIYKGVGMAVQKSKEARRRDDKQHAGKTALHK